MKGRVAWVIVLAACLGAIVAWRSRSGRQGTKQVHKAELQQWENEGGSLASPPEAMDARVTTGPA